MQPGSSPWTVCHSYRVADPAFDRNWQQGMGDAAVLGNVGVMWLAAGTTWVSPAGQQLVWQGGRWWNQTANRAATAEEAAAVNQAVAAARAAARLGTLTAEGGGVWWSSGGLRYGPDRRYGNRVQHVSRHAEADATRAVEHGVFDAGRAGMLGFIDEAWAIAQRGGPGVTSVV